MGKHDYQGKKHKVLWANSVDHYGADFIDRYDAARLFNQLRENSGTVFVERWEGENLVCSYHKEVAHA